MGSDLHLHRLQLCLLFLQLLLVDIYLQSLDLAQQPFKLLARHLQLQDVVVSVFVDPLLFFRIFQTAHKLFHGQQQSVVVGSHQQRASQYDSCCQDRQRRLQAHDPLQDPAVWRHKNVETARAADEPGDGKRIHLPLGKMLRPRQYHLSRLVKRHLVFVLSGYDQPAFLIQNIRNALISQTVDVKHGEQRLHTDHAPHRNTVLRIPAVHIIFHPVMNKRPLRVRRILSPALPQRLR